METEAARATTMCDIVDKAKDFLGVGLANLKGGTGETIRVGSGRVSK
jgi:hypothetical protein